MWPFRTCKPKRPVLSARQLADAGLPPTAVVLPSPEDFDAELEGLADALPWFGEEPCAPADEPSPPRDALDDDGYVRRILLAVLAGRPMSRAARRAGCSVRLVYNALERLIYVEDPFYYFDRWRQLGLLGVIDAPAFLRPSPDHEGSRFFELQQPAAIVCLLCHRLVCKTYVNHLLWMRRYDGSLAVPGGVELAAEISKDALESSEAHLILHFPLWGKLPPRAKNDELLEQLMESLGEHIPEIVASLPPEALMQIALGKPKRWPRRKPEPWQGHVPTGTWLAISRAGGEHAKPLTPIVGGRPLQPDAARRHYEALLARASGPVARSTVDLTRTLPGEDDSRGTLKGCGKREGGVTCL